jgi:methylmalonyl-CoA mutase cobalamin-binding domain/chain
LVGDGHTSDRGARALAESFTQAGIETVYIGRGLSANEIARAALDEQADSVAFCVAGGGGIALLRELLRELRAAGPGGVSIIVHRVE